MRRAALAALAAAAVLALAGCGGDYSDLVAIKRSGSLPDARVDIVVNDGGTVTCDGGETRDLPPKQLLLARDVVRALRSQMEDERVYPRASNALLRFRVETADGEMEFGDVDGARDADVGRLVQLTRTIAQESCGLAR